MVFVRLSLILFFRRLYAGTRTRWIAYCNILMVVITVIGIVWIFTYAFSCKPVEAAWNIWMRPTGKCEGGGKNNAVGRVLVAIVGNVNLMFDLMILVIPIKLIWTIQCSRSKKLEYLALMGLGVVYVSNVFFNLSLVSWSRKMLTSFDCLL